MPRTEKLTAKSRCPPAPPSHHRPGLAVAGGGAGAGSSSSGSSHSAARFQFLKWLSYILEWRPETATVDTALREYRSQVCLLRDCSNITWHEAFYRLMQNRMKCNIFSWQVYNMRQLKHTRMRSRGSRILVFVSYILTYIHMCNNPLNSQCALWRPGGRRAEVRAVTWPPPP